jgi:hypothetical protein
MPRVVGVRGSCGRFRLSSCGFFWALRIARGDTVISAESDSSDRKFTV